MAAKGKGIPVFSIVLNDDDRTGVSLVSFVESPAIQSNFVALSEQGLQVKLATDGMKQVLTGPVLIPDRNIVRLDEKGEPYYITFSAATIESIANKFFKKGKGLHKTNAEHEIALDGNYVVESWIITDPEKDKSAALGLSGLPVGTWMLSYKVEDAGYWKDEILTGKRKGFSLEGMFDYQPVTLAAEAEAGMAYTRYMDANLGYTRDQMPQIDLEVLPHFMGYFLAKYGTDAVSPTRFKISELKPAQKEISEEKVREKVDSGKWADREYLVSKDGHLLDGHHDWAAGLETNPDQEVSALLFSLPAADLIEEANTLKIIRKEALSQLINMSKKKVNKPKFNKMHKAYNTLKKLKPFLSTIPGFSAQATALGEMGEELATTTLADGTAVEIVDETGEVFLLDAEGNRTGAAPDGSHTLGDGSTIEVKDGKLVTEMAAATGDNNAAAVRELATAQAAAAAAAAQVQTLTATVATLTAQVQRLSSVPAVTTIEKETKLGDQKGEKPVSLADRVYQQALEMSKVTYKENK